MSGEDGSGVRAEVDLDLSGKHTKINQQHLEIYRQVIPPIEYKAKASHVGAHRCYGHANCLHAIPNNGKPYLKVVPY